MPIVKLITLFLLSSLMLASPTRRLPHTMPPDEVIEMVFKDICQKGCSSEEVALWKSNLKYEKHDLNGDGVPELFLHIDHSDWCGAGGNCDYWIFHKTKSGYALLLNDKVLRVKGTATKGYRDLASETPMGLCGQNIARLSVTFYKYDGQQYRALPQQTECRKFTPSAK